MRAPFVIVWSTGKGHTAGYPWSWAASHHLLPQCVHSQKDMLDYRFDGAVSWVYLAACLAYEVFQSGVARDVDDYDAIMYMTLNACTRR